MLRKACAAVLIFAFTLGGVSQADAASSYTVRSGDTFAKIAARSGISVSRLAALNPQVKNMNWIYVGQKLNLPTAGWEQKADAIINAGLKYWGTPYEYGAKRFQDKTFDCSSFTQFLFKQQGISLGWTAREQAVQGEWIPFSQIRKGDLLFFESSIFPNETGLSKVRHVGIYMGNGKVLHTYETGIGVTVSSLRNDAREGNMFYQQYLFAKRILK